MFNAFNNNQRNDRQAAMFDARAIAFNAKDIKGVALVE